MTQQIKESKTIPFWRDERILNILSQVLVLGVVVGFVHFLYSNMIQSLDRLGLPISFRFLETMAGFDIGESFIEYTRTSNFLQAFRVGIVNTLVISVWGILFSTLLGILVGVARLSTNWLIKQLSAWYIELIRNIPLLVLLIFWYRGVFLTLPPVREAASIGPMYLSRRGVAFPWGVPTDTYPAFLWVLGVGLFAAIVIAVILIRQGRKTGRMPLVSLWSTLAFVGIGLVGYFILPSAPLLFVYPAIPEIGFNFEGGKTFTPEFMALLSGLVLYTAAFIGEVVRAGILAVSKGQVEASRALGLTSLQTLRLVVFPQAMRVIVPPLTSQYLNLTKNSSLAIAIGYPDIVHVYGTIINTSGRAVEMTIIMMGTYLTFSLITSAFMNWYNKRIKLVER